MGLHFSAIVQGMPKILAVGPLYTFVLRVCQLCLAELALVVQCASCVLTYCSHTHRYPTTLMLSILVMNFHL